jgi:hypothetical protein
MCASRRGGGGLAGNRMFDAQARMQRSAARISILGGAVCAARGKMAPPSVADSPDSVRNCTEITAPRWPSVPNLAVNCSEKALGFF